jgi:hypothetical protein
MKIPAPLIHYGEPEMHLNTALPITEDARNRRLVMYRCVWFVSGDKTMHFVANYNIRKFHRKCNTRHYHTAGATVIISIRPPAIWKIT